MIASIIAQEIRPIDGTDGTPGSPGVAGNLSFCKIVHCIQPGYREYEVHVFI